MHAQSVELHKLGLLPVLARQSPAQLDNAMDTPPQPRNLCCTETPLRPLTHDYIVCLSWQQTKTVCNYREIVRHANRVPDVISQGG